MKSIQEALQDMMNLEMFVFHFSINCLFDSNIDIVLIFLFKPKQKAPLIFSFFVKCIFKSLVVSERECHVFL